MLGDSTAHAATQVLPLGACYTSEGDVVRARTYLHFPLDVFPPGAEILHAIIAHRSGGRPLTVEAGVLRIAEALDISREQADRLLIAGSVQVIDALARKRGPSC